MVEVGNDDIVLCEACESPEFLVYWAGHAVLIVCQECNKQRFLL